MSRPPRLPAGSVHFARVADLHPAEHPTRLALFLGDGLLVFDLTDSERARLPAGLHPHGWVAVTLDADGRPAELTPLSDTVPVPVVNPAGDALRWRAAPGGVPRRTLLRWRHRIVQAVRAWFDAQDFLEVETPALVRAPSPEPVFAPIAAGEGAHRDWLITSPEFQLKRLLVGGFPRIYRLGPVFRGGEAGAHHNPEFSLLEWYRAEPLGDDSASRADPTAALAADLEGLLAALVPLVTGFAEEAPPEAALHLRGRAAVLGRRPWRRATVRELFAEQLGMDLAGVVDAPALRAAARAAGVPDADALPDDFTAAFSALWVRIEAGLPPDPLLVGEWPAPTASLARLKPGDPTVAQRLELYAGGLELANGFAELTDPAEQRRRFAADLAARAAQGLPLVPLDEAFLAALAEGMPPSVGMALGVDRLVMLLTGAAHIRDVLPFAWDER